MNQMDPMNLINHNSLPIRIGIVGPVSTGKSTILNAIFAKTYSDAKLGRTTMIPQIYHESLDEISDTISDDSILKLNREFNDLFMNSSIDYTSNPTLKELHHKVKLIPNRQDFCLDEFCLLEVYDIPGINDSKTSDIYMEYLKTTLPMLDIVLLVLDINSALNTSDEMRILNIITDQIQKSKDLFMITILNKCDNLKLGFDNEPIIDDDYKDIYNQVNTEIKRISESKNIAQYINHISVLSSLDAYIYRIAFNNDISSLAPKYIDKLGDDFFGKYTFNQMSLENKIMNVRDRIKLTDINQTMKTCGYNFVASKLRDILTTDIINFYSKRLHEIIKTYENCEAFNVKNIEDTLKVYDQLHLTTKHIDKSHNSDINLIVRNSISKIMDSHIQTMNTIQILEESDIFKANQILEYLSSIKFNPLMCTLILSHSDKIDKIILNIKDKQNVFLCEEIKHITQIDEYEKILHTIYQNMYEKPPNGSMFRKAILKNTKLFLTNCKDIFKDDNMFKFINIACKYVSQDIVSMIYSLMIDCRIDNKFASSEDDALYYMYILKYKLLKLSDIDIVANILIKLDNYIKQFHESIVIDKLDIFMTLEMTLENNYIEYIKLHPPQSLIICDTIDTICTYSTVELNIDIDTEELEDLKIKVNRNTKHIKELKTAAQKAIEIKRSKLNSLKQSQIKSMCDAYNITNTGKKNILIDKLIEAGADAQLELYENFDI